MRFSHLGFASFAAALVLASPARADLVITVDKSAQQMTVADDGTVLYTWPVSTGMADYDTPTGEFKPFRMERDHFSREWDDAPMPYSIFFTQEGHAIHGSYDVKHLGRPASHGCVRLSHPHAATLFSLVQQEGISNTRVVLTGEIPDAESHRYDKSRTLEIGSLYPTTPNVGSPEWKQEQAENEHKGATAKANDRRYLSRLLTETPVSKFVVRRAAHRAAPWPPSDRGCQSLR